MLPPEEYRDGMVTPTTRDGPSAATARAQVTAESIPPDKPISAEENPVFRT